MQTTKHNNSYASAVAWWITLYVNYRNLRLCLAILRGSAYQIDYQSCYHFSNNIFYVVADLLWAVSLRRCIPLSKGH